MVTTGDCRWLTENEVDTNPPLCSLAVTTLGWTYHYSNKAMDWAQARQFCQENYTDMVVIQSQRENDHLVSLLPNRISSPYYWIGITKNHKNETWRWIGNNSTWIGNQSWAEDEPNNNYSNEFCVEIYVNKGKNRGKWNDEKCSNPKYAVCYKSQCTESSCVRGTCHETVENTTCLCEPGFKGDRCQTGSSAITCGATGVWSGPRPTCTSSDGCVWMWSCLSLLLHLSLLDEAQKKKETYPSKAARRSDESIQ
ncbi:L-selectin isoform X10 [Lates calcarifer]|uniref:L-selectin isoform X10 n=1 Tax=Lates calcarifer TaxID=8187 RepID=A0AAJ8BH46_LATCA|nr:L-selectin isoform X10 [Lates calcarifer]